MSLNCLFFIERKMSLRAKRSNPKYVLYFSMDCFGRRLPRNDRIIPLDRNFYCCYYIFNNNESEKDHEIIYGTLRFPCSQY